jgi:hypothetical protein
MQMSALAVIDAHSQTNSVPPTDGVPWDNVGSHNGSSGVYLGERWVLSAWHVGPGDISLLGANYTYDGIYFRLTNTSLANLTDLVLFHLTSSPPLTNLVLSSATPPINSAVDAIGCGRISGGPTNVGSFSGFSWGPYTGVKTWGNNKLSGSGTRTDVPQGDQTNSTICFPTAFSSTSQATHECQLAPQDSGGGSFYLSNATWQLIGINLYVSPNDSINSAALYGSSSYYGDIATYRNQIIWRMTTGARPYLSVQKNGANVQVSWPLAATGYRLQAASSLTGTWTALTAALAAAGSTNLPSTNTMRFFRLIKP